MTTRRKPALRIEKCYCGATYHTNAPNDPYCSQACKARVAAQRVRAAIGTRRTRGGARWKR